MVVNQDGTSAADSAPSGTGAASPESEAARPLLRVLNPDATPEEIAAVVAVFASLGGGAPAPEPVRSEWSHPRRLHRTTHATGLPQGRGGWRASGLPR
ncbi:acyl-CoA carboxylase subunit epsilon [Nocardioides acrostichi]|uniref:Acyl-CoA carboxylase subunit epsilon n=1 Tax=Nocardioides acrostichi TaxID=2784339 RepID=A0A930Y611_9ACTN|nr:acyl-CoA carboxylase subunit epsilon [Nocardioides acrostichi]MBF4161825.1 acyl-CoA carboxylase subunit epsilon [Nocardioides acrostichi]